MPKATKYVVRDGAHIMKADVQVLSKTLDVLSKHGKEAIAPADLVEHARPKSSPTHHLFEWDDKKAAEEHRLQVARTYLGAFEIVIEGSNEPVRAFPTVTRGGRTEYVPMNVVLSSKELTKQVIDSALRELRGWEHRYASLRSIAKLSGVFEAIGAAVMPPFTYQEEE